MACTQEQHPPRRHAERDGELNEPDLQCAYLPVEGSRDDLRQWKGRALGGVCFSALPPEPGAAGLPLVHVPMPALDPGGLARSACEMWSAHGASCYGDRHGVKYGHNEDVLFGAISLDDAQFDAAAAHDGKAPLQRASESVYQAIFDVADELRFPHILRFWNYIGNITGESHGLERYRQFNLGRQDAFLSRGRTVTGSVPAASAVGIGHGGLTVYFLAGRGPAPVAIENPRQVSAYRYPARYGPRSPTFSRASVARVGKNDILFLSGTASIVGHETLHAGDVVAQTRETLANIAALVEEAGKAAPQAGFAMASLCYKVYVRRPADVPAIDAELRRALGPDGRILYLRADICRQDLLMEIEAAGGHPFHFPARP